MSDGSVDVVPPRDLVRFYQTYMIMKDTQEIKPVARKLSVKVPAVQLATAFVAALALLMLVILIGCCRYVLFRLRHRGALHLIPQSKLDWLLQATRADDDGLYQDTESGVTPWTSKRAEFENARWPAPVAMATASSSVQQSSEAPNKMERHEH
jgi:hypothetical protein